LAEIDDCRYHLPPLPGLVEANGKNRKREQGGRSVENLQHTQLNFMDHLFLGSAGSQRTSERNKKSERIICEKICIIYIYRII